MAKRFITTELFKDAWFMDLPNKYKLFWIFLITDCDHAGVWQVNYKTASFYVGDHLEPGECERFLKDRFIKIEEGKYWFIPKFIDFQYGRELNFSNRAVRSVIEVLKKYNLFEYLPKTNITEGATKELPSTLQGVKDKDKDKDKDKGKDKGKDKHAFDDWWNLYDYKVNRKKCIKLWNRIDDFNKEKIMNHTPKYVASTPDKAFRLHPSTYLHNDAWENEIVFKQENNLNKKDGYTYAEAAALSNGKMKNWRKEGDKWLPPVN